MDAKVVQANAMRVAAIKGVGPFEQTIPESFKRLMAYADVLCFERPEAEWLAVFCSDPRTTPSDQLVAYAGVTVGPEVEATGDLEIVELPGGWHATTRHVGPYRALKKTWGALVDDWMPQQGLSPRPAPCFEIYRNDPSQTKPVDLITDLYEPTYDQPA